MNSFIRKNITIVKNFASLSFLNLVNFAVPVVILPYLIEVLGVVGYGQYAFTFSVIAYMLILVNFGFNFSATKEIAQNRMNPKELSKIFTEVFVIRVILAVVALGFTFSVMCFIPKFEEIRVLLLCASGVIFGTVLIPTFFFQGMEKMQYVTLAGTIPQLIMVILVFSYVNQKEHIYLLMLIQSFGFLLSGTISFYLCIRYLNARLVRVSLKGLFYRIRESSQLFYSTVGMSLYRESGTFILGLLAPYAAVGYYSAAEKIVRAIQAILNPLAQSIFPHFAVRFQAARWGRKLSLLKYSKFLKIYGVFLIMITLGVVFLVPPIVEYFTGDKYRDSITDLKILSPLILFGSLNYLIGIVGLVNLGKDKYFSKSVFISGTVAIILNVILAYSFQDFGVSIAVVTSEILLFVLLLKKFKSFI